MSPTIEVLAQLIRQSCTRETSASPCLWDSDNPMFGHCLLAALIVQDYYGGDIVCINIPKDQRVFARFDNHYWNCVDGRHVDITAEQFPRWYYQKQRSRWYAECSVFHRHDFADQRPRTNESYLKLLHDVQRLMAWEMSTAFD